MLVRISPNSTEEIGSKRGGLSRPWRVTAIVTSLVMELSWVTLCYVILFQSRAGVSYWQAFVVLGFMLFTSYLVVYFMDSNRIRLQLRRILLAIMIILFIFIGLKTLLYARQTIGLLDLINLPVRTFRDMYYLVPSEFVLMLMVLWISWRGITHVGKVVSSQEAVGNFKLGVLMFLGYGFVSSLAHITSGNELYLFLFAGLLAMSSARISVASYLRGGQRIPFDKRWITGLSLISLLMVLIAAGIMRAAGGSGGGILATVVTWIIYAIALILSPMMYLFLQLLLFLGRLINISEMIQGLVDLANRLQMMINALTANIENSLSHFQLPPSLARLAESLTLSKPVILWGIIILFLVIILMIARNQVFRERDETDAVSERLDQPEGILDQLRKALLKGLGAAADNLGEVWRLRNARQVLAAARIRRIYAHLMLLCERLDQPRPASRTPLEFLPNLEALFPGFKGELNTITEAYLRVRYGDLPELSEEVEAVELAWQNVSKVGNEKVKETKTARRSRIN